VDSLLKIVWHVLILNLFYSSSNRSLISSHCNLYCRLQPAHAFSSKAT